MTKKMPDLALFLSLCKFRAKNLVLVIVNEELRVVIKLVFV